jgi:hypothetical protein
MPYCDKLEVETWAQITSADFGSIGYDYVNTLQYVINLADRAIDNYCMQPDGFFNGGGIEIQKELHDGVEFGYVGFNVWLSSHDYRPFLRLKYVPVLSITKFEEETTAGSWTTRTEGRSSDYIVDESGIYIVSNLPDYDYRNIRVTYKTGYTSTPSPIKECSVRLAASMLHRIKDSTTRITTTGLGSKSDTMGSEFQGLGKVTLSDEMKDELMQYRRKVAIKLV